MKRKPYIKIGVSIFLGAFCFIWIYPFLWMFSASFKTTMELFTSGLRLVPKSFSFDSYARAWVKGGFSVYFMNSVLVTLSTILIVVARCALAGYVLAMYDFKGKTLLMALFLATFMIPGGTTIIPTVELSQKMGLLNSRFGLVLAMAGGGNIVSIFLYKAFFEKTPRSLAEAATIDGAGFFTVFSKIMLPMTGAVTATTVIMTFMTSWNNFMLPLVFTFGTPQNRTLPVGMMAFQSVNETDWSGMTAAGTMTLVPVLVVFIVLQKYFVSSIAGAIKE